MRIETSEAEGGPPEDEAVACLMSEAPKRRVRGLSLIAETDDPDLFEWCAMFLRDPSTAVRVAALDTMRGCDAGDPEVIVPHTESENKRVRAAAFAAITRHARRDTPHWFEYGLKDPEPCVRIETARQLVRLDTAEHRDLFEIALYDTNPAVSRIAHKLTQGKGFSEFVKFIEESGLKIHNLQKFIHPAHMPALLGNIDYLLYFEKDNPIEFLA